MRFCPQCGVRFPDDSQFCPHDGTATQSVDLPSTADPLVGQVIDDRYRVEGRIGQGGMGVVYRAKHVMLDKVLALKVLRSDMASDQESVQRFINEARAASSIGHPNIVDISDFGTLPNGAVYFAMEYLDGEPLSDVIDDSGGIEAPRAVHILTQIASALAAAHAQGITHRDLKPDNILTVRKGGDDSFVKVLDFGIAKVAGARNKLTRTGMVFGTPDYMAPEQAAGEPVDARTDVYALGVIAYELCTGEVPFKADTFVGVVTKHMREAPKPPSEWSAHFAKQFKGFEPVIMKALEKKPGKRYPSMHAFIDALHRVCGQEGIRTRAPLSRGLAQTASAEKVILADSTAPTPSVKLPIRGKRLPRMVLAVSAIGLAIVLPLLATQSGTTGEVQGTRNPNTATDIDPQPEFPLEENEQPPEMAYVEITSVPDRATVWRAGEPVGFTPFSCVRPEGTDVEEFVLRVDGFRDHVVEISSESGEYIEVEFERIRVPDGRRPHTSIRDPRPSSMNIAPDPGSSPVPNMTTMSDTGMSDTGMSPASPVSSGQNGSSMSLETLRGFDEKW